MSGIKRSQAIKGFLDKHTLPELAALYTYEMETQVNVAQDGGERIDSQFQGVPYVSYTDGIQTWKSFRIPLKAMLVPEDNDHEIRFDLELHVEGIGLTGWNWIKRRSMHVAYDFDAIVGHSDAHTKKLSQSELEDIKRRVSEIEWVTLRRSTGGSGLHVYVFLDFDEVINNHNEHMAIGRSVLSQLSAIAGFDFEAKVDVNAGNMWIWHRKLIKPDGSRNPDGLALLKQGSRLKTIPKDWRDYVDVVTGKRRRTVPFFIKTSENPQKELDLFEELSNQRPKIPLDKEHQKLLDWIQHNTPGGSWWRDDHWMLVTHTATLKQAHIALNLNGPFETIATGSEFGSDWNCFAFPLPNGAWTVRRYTRGCEEAISWMQDGQGWTRCVYNKLPDFKMACKLHGGVEKSNGGWVFNEARRAVEAAKMLGATLTIAEKLLARTAVLEQHKDKRLIIKIEKETKDTADGMEGYDGTGKTWTRIVEGKIDQTQPMVDTLGLDKIIRHIVNEGGRDEGWVVKSEGEWRDEPLEHIKLILKGHFGYKPAEAEQILGTGAIQPYKLVNRPFDVEYPPGRLWNRKGAKLRFEPSQNIEELKFPTWLKIFNHLGHGLTPFIEINPWAKANNVTTGADYLIIWISALFQKPYQRLPYLFLYSDEQNTGKSTFHEAIILLMAGDPPAGYMKVNEALKAQASFNAELHHAILCVVEELDLNPRRSDAKISYNRIKELVTANEISIHKKTQTPTMVKNTTHWVQCANERTACPIFKNDSRITMIRVNVIDDIDMIPKGKLLEMLLREGPDFLAHILRLEIPPSNDRLIVPVIETEDKRHIQTANLSLVEQFIHENCHIVDGAMILWAEFYQTFALQLESADIEKWSKKYCGFHLPDYHPRGRRKVDNQYMIANLSWHAKAPDDPIKERLVLRNEYLVPLSTSNGLLKKEVSSADSISK